MSHSPPGRYMSWSSNTYQRNWSFSSVLCQPAASYHQFVFCGSSATSSPFLAVKIAGFCAPASSDRRAIPSAPVTDCPDDAGRSCILTPSSARPSFSDVAHATISEESVNASSPIAVTSTQAHTASRRYRRDADCTRVVGSAITITWPWPSFSPGLRSILVSAISSGCDCTATVFDSSSRPGGTLPAAVPLFCCQSFMKVANCTQFSGLTEYRLTFMLL